VSTNHDDENPSSRRLWRLVGVAGVLAIPLLVIWWPGCRQYPSLTSKEGMQQMKLLYAACNTKDTERLGRVEQGVEKMTREGKLSPAELEAFSKIIGMAKASDWERAEKAAFKFAQDQVGQGHPAPDEHDHHHDKKPQKGNPKR